MIPRVIVRLLDLLTGRLTEPPGTLTATPPLNPHAAPDPEARCALCGWPLRLHGSVIGSDSHAFTPARIDAPADAPHIPDDGRI